MFRRAASAPAGERQVSISAPMCVRVEVSEKSAAPLAGCSLAGARGSEPTCTLKHLLRAPHLLPSTEMLSVLCLPGAVRQNQIN